MIECVVNISEGRRDEVLASLADVCGDDLLDVHTDPHHNRSVFTLIGTDAPRRLTARAIEVVDLSDHRGVHPRIGAVDVVPFVPLEGSTMGDAIRTRDAFALWAGTELGLPCFLYGPKRSLPQVRRGSFTSLIPDTGPDAPHPSAGACAVGARGLLVAYNVWVDAPDLDSVRRVASAVRAPAVRTLGLHVGDRFQVSCNLIAPAVAGPADVERSVVRAGAAEGIVVTGCELVGLVPAAVLDDIDRSEWDRLDLSTDGTIESRLARRSGR